jgi:hypothetical protein
MPIRPDLRHLYRTPEYVEARARVVERSGDRCEQCGKRNGSIVETVTGKEDGKHFMWWRGIGPWVDDSGHEWRHLDVRCATRIVIVHIGLAHLDHNPANNADENLKFLCGWCHLHYDQLHHKETRSIRKDRQRPLLQA